MVSPNLKLCYYVEGVLQGFDSFMNLVINDGVEIQSTDKVIIVNIDFANPLNKEKIQGERKEIGSLVIRGKSVESLRVLETFTNPLPQ